VNVVEVMRGRDGKLYPVGGHLPRDERNRARWLAHSLRCRDRLSVRRVQRELAARGMRRSLGIIARDLARFECPDCREAPGD
jgi:hypothetical protein